MKIDFDEMISGHTHTITSLVNMKKTHIPKSSKRRQRVCVCGCAEMFHVKEYRYGGNGNKEWLCEVCYLNNPTFDIWHKFNESLDSYVERIRNE